jgi:putative ABC transport system permease protein
MEGFLNDLRYALRTLIKARAFTVAAIAALTLGIGANTAIFSVVNAVLLRPVDAPDADRIVFFMNTSPQGSGSAASPAKFAHWRAQSSVVTDVSAFNTGIVNFVEGGEPQQLRSGRVSADFFKLLRVPMTQGRTFNAAEDAPNGEKVVVLAHSTWVRKFSSDPNIVGKSISLSGEPHIVIGVLGEYSFRELGGEPEVFVAFQLDPNTTDQGHYFRAVGRLVPGVTLEQAQAKLNASAAEYRAKFPAALQNNASFGVKPVRDVLVQGVRGTLLALAAAVVLVLLIACANVANLLLARATGRGREMAIRTAMGGSRTRIIQQLLTESLVLSSLGAVLGLALGVLGMRALLSVNTANLPRVGEAGTFVELDWHVVAFTVALALITGVVFGIIPALKTSRTDLTTTLKEGGGRAGTGLHHNLTRSVLVVVEMALALMLLIGASLLIRTSLALGRVDPGFDATNVLTMRMSLTGPQYLSAAGVSQLVRNGIDRLQAMPGVESASATCCVPLTGGYGLPFIIAGRPLEGQGAFHGGGSWTTISPGYFEVFRIPVKRGRSFTDRDDASTQPVVIINEAFAKQYFKDQDPLTQRLTIGKGVMREFSTETERQIIGVVGDMHDGGLDNDPGPQMFIPQSQVPDAANALNVRLTPMAWVVRTRTDVHPMSQSIQEAVRQVAGLPVANVQAMGDIVSTSTSRQRFNMWLMAMFGGSALLLAAIGIYGLMAYSVAQRQQELGIRLALGAPASQVRNMVVRQGMLLAIVGVAAGLLGAFFLVKQMGAYFTLFRVDARDPISFAAVPIVLALIALFAVLVPAIRASRVDPLRALRYE